MIDLRIIFMGTPEFAVPSLKALVAGGWQVVAVVTAPDKKKGRGQSVIPSPVKEYAVSQGLPVLQPTNLKSQKFLDELQTFKANLQVVVAFRMLPEVVWHMPDLGSFNLHASLLPDYRGAAPINWAIINGEKVTGVTTFFLQHEIDTGAIIFQEKEPIHDDDTVGSLYERLMNKGASLVEKTVRAIASGAVKSQPQTIPEKIKTAPKIFKETCQIDWQQNFATIRNFVRGLDPYPGAWTMLGKESCKVFGVKKSDYSTEASYGAVRTDHKSRILLRSADCWVELTEIQLPGKKRMKTDDLLRGNTMENIQAL